MPHFVIPHGSNGMDDHDKPSLPEVVASVLAAASVAATIWLAIVDADASAKTALTGLVGASSAFFLTKQLKMNGNGNGASKPSSEPPKSEGVAQG